jgi:hypothetical protein
MKKNKVLKIFFIIAIAGIISMLLCQCVQGWTIDTEPFDNVSAGRTGNTVTKIVGALINIVSTISAGIAIIMLVIIGVTYVIKGPEGKAEVKKGLISYVVGAIILFAASGILKLLQVFIDGNINNTNT